MAEPKAPPSEAALLRSGQRRVNSLQEHGPVGDRYAGSALDSRAYGAVWRVDRG
jgi:hypothetical protein